MLTQTFINDSSPHFIYRLEISFLESTYYLNKQFPQFVKLQKKLLDYRLSTAETEKNLLLEDFLPKLDTGGFFSYFESAACQAKREASAIEKFSLQLLKLTLSGVFDPNEKCMRKIADFFELDRCLDSHENSKTSIRIRDPNTKLLNLSNGLIIHILSFCEKKDLFQVAQVSREMNKLAMSSYLWQEISFKSRPEVAKDSVIATITHQFTLLSCLDLSYCDDIGNKSGFSISQNCNSAVFKELRLDGCRKINDTVLKTLLSKYASPSESPEAPTEKT